MTDKRASPPLKAKAMKVEDTDDELEDEMASELVGYMASKPKREGKSTLVYVNGQPVLKRNMYDLQGGEPSVFEREQAKGRGDAEYEQTEGVTLAPPPRRAHIVKPKGPSAPKVMAPHHIARKSHNDSIRKDAAADAAIRAVYLSKHLDKLRHFVPASVIDSIRSKAAKAPGGWKAPDPITQQPASITATLREYQLEGVAWLVSKFHNGVNAILADEMGLGKTLQTITLLAHLKELGIAGPHLVVVPLSVLPSWMAEFKKWCPTFRVVRLHCNDESERDRLRKEVLAKPDSFDVAVTTYDTIHGSLGEALKHSITWRYVVLDEAHKVKNEETLISLAMRQISRQHTLMLTGTPVQNNLRELFALLNFMYPDVFTDVSMFDKAFDLTAGLVDDAKLEAAHFLLRPFLLRRIKDEVDVNLPPKVEIKINCPLSEMQTFWYRRLLMRETTLLKNMETEMEAKGAVKFKAEGNSWKQMMMLLMQLRKVCIHPYMFSDAEPDFDGETTGEDIVEASGKLKVLDLMLAKLKAKGHRVVLFSQFTMALNIVQDYLIMRGYNYRRLDGDTNRIQRMIDMEQFNKPGSDIFIYILSTRAGGLGVNLQTADTCIIMDSDFNPQCDLQAMARVHRIGQTKPVHIYRLVSDGTAEDRVHKRAESKLYLDQMVNRGSTANAEGMENLGKKELLSMLKFGADRIFQNESGTMPTDADLEAIMDRSKMLAKALLPSAPAPAGTNGDATTSGGITMAAGSISAISAAEEAALTSVSGPDVASTSADGGAAAMMLVDTKHTALDFNAELAPYSSFVFGGVDYRELRAAARKAGESFGDIGKQYWAGKRDRNTRLITIDGYDVLRENNYSIEEGGISIGIKTVERKRKHQKAGRDYSHHDTCQVCWDGGDLVCCDHCPASYHLSCLGLTFEDLPTFAGWSCPHHSCTQCGRNTSAAGGLLFRCDMCHDAYCEDHMPADYDMVGENDLFKALGQTHPTNACFITCSDRCKELKVDYAQHLGKTITELENNIDERIEELRVEAAEKVEMQNRKVQAAKNEKAAKAAKKRIDRAFLAGAGRFAPKPSKRFCK